MLQFFQNYSCFLISYQAENEAAKLFEQERELVELREYRARAQGRNRDSQAGLAFVSTLSYKLNKIPDFNAVIFLLSSLIWISFYVLLCPSPKYVKVCHSIRVRSTYSCPQATGPSSLRRRHSISSSFALTTLYFLIIYLFAQLRRSFSSLPVFSERIMYRVLVSCNYLPFSLWPRHIDFDLYAGSGVFLVM